MTLNTFCVVQNTCGPTFLFSAAVSSDMFQGLIHQLHFMCHSILLLLYICIFADFSSNNKSHQNLNLVATKTSGLSISVM